MDATSCAVVRGLALIQPSECVVSRLRYSGHAVDVDKAISSVWIDKVIGGTCQLTCVNQADSHDCLLSAMCCRLRSTGEGPEQTGL